MSLERHAKKSHIALNITRKKAVIQLAPQVVKTWYIVSGSQKELVLNLEGMDRRQGESQ
ncbi:MAG: hypothetical protein JNJ60_14670 [Rhodocyclaceae bacterium]|nr:hypothetical protein [Rhodocyclaceae bacterium]